MGPPPNQRSQPMLMSLQPTPVPVPHTGIVFSGDRGCKLTGQYMSTEIGRIISL